MTDRQSQLDSFVAAVRRRLNRHRLWTQMIRAFAMSASLLLVIALTYVLRGHEVPAYWYAIAAGAVGALAFLLWLARRVGNEHAAHFADRHFQLQDSVSSCRHFAQTGKEGGFYQLQSRQTGSRITDLDASAIRYPIPHRTLTVALLVAVAAILLGFKAPSESVQRQRELEQQTLAETRRINEHLESLIDELEKMTDETEEQELIDPNKLREWVEQLKATKDRKEALRQYGRFERRVADAASQLIDKRDEQLLTRAAQELEKDRSTKDLSQQLKQKKYEQAAKQLDDLRPSSNKKLDEQRKKLGRLKSAARRMADAARNSRNEQNNAPSRDSNINAKPLPIDEDLAKLLEDLETAVEDWDEALENAQLQELEFGEIKELTLAECELCEGEAGEKLDKLILRLCKLGHKGKARLLLASLCKAAGQCQSSVSSPMAGGHRAGWGTNANQREQTDPLLNNGQYTQLKGTHGQGPSAVTVEEAADGTGTATRKSPARNREFQRQVESFIQREDVPDAVKAGVKEYFRSIHQTSDGAEVVQGELGGCRWPRHSTLSPSSDHPRRSIINLQLSTSNSQLPTLNFHS